MPRSTRLGSPGLFGGLPRVPVPAVQHVAARIELLFLLRELWPLPLWRLGIEHGFGWNPDLLLRLGIKARARLPLLFHQLAKAGQNEFAVLFSRFVSQGAERIEKYSSGLHIGLGCFGKSELKFCFGHL
jgi:hypothetical protein